MVPNKHWPKVLDPDRMETNADPQQCIKANQERAGEITVEKDLWLLVRVADPDPYPDWIRIQEGKNDQQK